MKPEFGFFDGLLALCTELPLPGIYGILELIALSARHGSDIGFTDRLLALCIELLCLASMDLEFIA